MKPTPAGLDPDLPVLDTAAFYNNGKSWAYFILAREAVKAFIRIAAAFDAIVAHLAQDRWREDNPDA